MTGTTGVQTRTDGRRRGAGEAGACGGRRRWLAGACGAAVGALVAGAGCVMWPSGTGPNAEPMPLAEAVDRRDRGEVVIVDVRSRALYDEGHIPGAISIPVDEFPARTAEIRRLGRLPVLYCG